LQDGQAIKVSERIAAAQVLASLEQQLLQELQAEGVDVAAAAGVEDDSSMPDGEVAETGFVDEAGELRRPWCPATRVLEHREMVRRQAVQGAPPHMRAWLLAAAYYLDSSYWGMFEAQLAAVLQLHWYHKQQHVLAVLPCVTSPTRALAYLQPTVGVLGIQLFLQEKANREADAARSAAQKDPLAQAPPPPRLEVRHAVLASTTRLAAHVHNTCLQDRGAAYSSMVIN
jgi:hypothetical protein